MTTTDPLATIGPRTATRPVVWLRRLAAAGILAAVAWRVGAEPFVDGIRRIDGPALALGLLLGLVATVANALRWRAVAEVFGVGMGAGEAVVSCYRSQFLNSVLPGGIVGDVERGLRHGSAGRRRSSLAAVAAERGAGLLVLLATSAVALTVLPSSLLPSRVGGATVVGLLLAGALVMVAAAPWLPGWAAELLRPRPLAVVTTASLVAIASYAATFVVAARTAGVEASGTRLVGLGLVALVAMAVPVSIAGWGPREGTAAWAFAAAGLGAASGVTTAVVYGVLSLVANLPGGVALVLARRGRVDAAGRPGVPEVSHD